MIIGTIGFAVGVLATGLVWYVKDYCFDCLYLKGYAKGYKKATKDSLKVYEDALEQMKEEGNT